MCAMHSMQPLKNYLGLLLELHTDSFRSRALQLRAISVMYFLAFAITVPVASYMIVYGLYLFKSYIFEHVTHTTTARNFFRFPARSLYDAVRNSMRERSKTFEANVV